ncbi:shikimate dehydrogenase family protein [Tenacibaculum sp. M341]|uniref:shikimate dehydrogenase family protein n=1 Tax=Tenacibaculum sp. M341 TaxID=2530339 RepID=UPI00104B28F8|nr:shikimate dehydrogenase [Tenacibaculum sp. M341]TCI91886.1 shikimate dehydrogenase [Tenacibaculum sp. M341]
MATEENNYLFGLLGKNISYSFSRGYFSEKFELLKLVNHKYVNFDIQDISELKTVLKENEPSLKGMNVTIPYKETVFQYLDKVDKKARQIGAVNTIKFTKKGKLIGYNTDFYGFKNSIKPLLKTHHKKALILGTGGASKAIAYALKKLNIEYKFVSRSGDGETILSYNDLNEKIITEYNILINCTPLGTHPNTDQSPNIPYEFISNKHLLYDLIYNPSETLFLSKGKQQGAAIKNGLEMLELQAEKAWEIWQ